VPSSPDRQNKTPAFGNGCELRAGSVPADVAIVPLSRPRARSLGARNLALPKRTARTGNSTEHNRQNREDRDNPSRSWGVDLGTPPAGLCVPGVGSRPRSRSIPCSARTPHVGPDLSMARIPTWAWNTLYSPRREAHGASISLPRGHLPPRSSPQWYSGSASAPFHRAQRSRGQEVRSPSPPFRSRFGPLGRYAYAPCHVLARDGAFGGSAKCAVFSQS